MLRFQALTHAPIHTAIVYRIHREYRIHHSKTIQCNVLFHFPLSVLGCIFLSSFFVLFIRFYCIENAIYIQNECVSMLLLLLFFSINSSFNLLRLTAFAFDSLTSASCYARNDEMGLCFLCFVWTGVYCICCMCMYV